MGFACLHGTMMSKGHPRHSRCFWLGARSSSIFHLTDSASVSLFP